MRKDSMEAILRRAVNLVRMDNDLRQRVNDEDFMDLWLMEGMPDGTIECHDFDMVLEIAHENWEYGDFVKLYTRICRLDGIEPIPMTELVVEYDE